MFLLSRKIPNFSRLAKTFVPSQGQHTLPRLPYDYKALEPNICQEILEIHHQKHHQTYVTNLNIAHEKFKEALKNSDITKIIEAQAALKFNGGGHINHSIFWDSLSPVKMLPKDDLKAVIEEDLGGIEQFKKDLAALTIGVQGSGWGWLGYNKKICKLELATSANEDPLEATTGLVPLFGIDVWEHAYYLQYKNVRPRYIEAIFEIINWDDISSRLKRAKMI